jgi:hypothetical protein
VEDGIDVRQWELARCLKEGLWATVLRVVAIFLEEAGKQENQWEITGMSLSLLAVGGEGGDPVDQGLHTF